MAKIIIYTITTIPPTNHEGQQPKQWVVTDFPGIHQEKCPRVRPRTMGTVQGHDRDSVGTRVVAPLAELTVGGPATLRIKEPKAP